MRSIKLITLCFTCCLLTSMSAFADVVVDGLKYELHGSVAYVSGYEGSPTEVVIPETIETNGQSFSVTHIKASAFKQCSSITSLTSTGKNLTSIGSDAFRECPNLTQVTLTCAEESTIGYFAFYSCSSLKELDLTCTAILGHAFHSCTNLQKVILSEVESIGGNFNTGQIYYYDIERWYGYSFAGCTNLVFVDLGEKLESVSNYSFASCSKLTYVVIPPNCHFYRFNMNTTSGGFAIGYGDWEISDEKNNIFSGCTLLHAIIYLGDQTSKCGSNASVYYPKNQINWSSTSYDYQGKEPIATFTSNMPAGFVTTTNDIALLEKETGTYTQNVSFTFINDDMSFNIDIPYTYTIKPITLTARVKDAMRLYGNPDPQFSSTYYGFVNDEDASVITSHGNYTSTAKAYSDVGTYSIKQSGAIAQNYVFVYEDGTLTVNKAPLVMTANDKTMTYGGSMPVLDARYEGLKNNETQPAWITEPTITTTATPKSRAAQYPITICNANAKNYDLTIYGGTMTVEKALLTAKVDNKSRLYGDANPEFTLTYTGLKNGETIPEWDQQPSFETEATAASCVGSYPVSLMNAVAVNYDITPIDGTLIVNKAQLKVTPKDATRKYGEQNPQFELLYEGLKNSENQPEWTEEPVITTSAITSSSVGEYAIQVKSAVARNYTLEKSNGKLTITKAPLTIKLNDATRRYGMSNPNFEMTYIGLVNEETTPTWTTYPTISTPAKEKSDVGEYPIIADGGELKNYEYEGIVPAVLTVTPASLLIKALDASRSYYEENPQLNFDCIGFAADDNTSSFTTMPVVTTTATKQSPAGLYPIEVSGAEIKNYQLSYEKGQLTVNQRMLTVSTSDYTRAYGEENPEFVLRYKGFVNNEDENVLMAKPKANTIADKNTDTGIYDITIGNGVAENYAFTYVGGKLTIEKAYQTLKWEQSLENTKQYEQVELTAVASSGLEVLYILEPNDICTLVKIGRKQYLDCYGEGVAVLSAVQEGNRNYWQTTKMYKTVKIGTAAGINETSFQLDEDAKIYDIKGNRLRKLQRGINIIIMGNGTKKKVVVK